MRRLLIYFIVLMVVSCTPDFSDDDIPWQPFDVININLNLPEFIRLKMDGSYLYIPGGVRDLILYRKNASNYITYERNCSFQPNSACATVDVHVSTLYMLCSCCSSTFDLTTGYPTGGQAWRPLRKYATSLNGSQLTITDQIVE